jgi:hypothetical protein
MGSAVAHPIADRSVADAPAPPSAEGYGANVGKTYVDDGLGALFPQPATASTMATKAIAIGRNRVTSRVLMLIPVFEPFGFPTASY